MAGIRRANAEAVATDAVGCDSAHCTRDDDDACSAGEAGLRIGVLTLLTMGIRSLQWSPTVDDARFRGRSRAKLKGMERTECEATPHHGAIFPGSSTRQELRAGSHGFVADPVCCQARH
jgi:hypothetical protein